MNPYPKVNQVWRNKDPEPFLPDSMHTIRIIAFHPDGGILYNYPERQNGTVLKHEVRWVVWHHLTDSYTLEKDVCDHHGCELLDWYSNKDYPSPVPDYYKCASCGDIFPNTGDTDLWFPKVLEGESNG